MCGIFFYTGKSGVGEEFTYKGIKKLEYRGYDSFGVGGIDDKGKVYVQKFIGKVSDEKNENKFQQHKCKLALGHTRWATHGGVTINNAHPHISYDGKILLVHNGIFENFQEVKDELMNKKIKCKGETDSEVMVNWIAYRMSHENLSLSQAAQKCFTQARGSSAFIAVDTQTKEWVLYRNGSALHLGKVSDGEYVAASDVSVLFEHTQDICSLKDGDCISSQNITSIKFKKINTTTDVADKGKYKHFTIKEIFDQTWSIEKAYSSTSTFTDKELDQLKKKQIIFTGCGTAYNVALTAVYLLAQKGIVARAIPANEFESFKSTLDKNTLLFAISQSGETADTMIACKTVKEKNGTVFAMLNNMYSSMAQMADRVFPIHAGVEIGVVSTKAFSGQITTLMKLFGFTISKQDFELFTEWMQDKKLHVQCKKIAKKYCRRESLYIIGKSLCAPVGSEMALKIKEASYMHAESFAAGELKHGVISLIEKGTLAIVCDGVESASVDLENSATQIHSRGGDLVGVGFENKNYYKHFIQIPKINNLSILAVSFVGQLLAYYFTIAKNLDPDKPRNLAKSVTVK